MANFFHSRMTLHDSSRFGAFRNIIETPEGKVVIQVKRYYCSRSEDPMRHFKAAKRRQAISHGVRLKPYYKVEALEDQFIIKLKSGYGTLTDLLETVYTFREWRKSLDFLDFVKPETKMNLDFCIENLEEILNRVIASYNDLFKSSLVFVNSHVSLYKAEDYMLSYEQNLVIFFKSKKLINQDLTRLNRALGKLGFIFDLKAFIETSQKQSNMGVLDENTLSLIENEIKKFQSIKILVPGDKRLPFEFNPDSLIYNLQREENFKKN